VWIVSHIGFIDSNFDPDRGLTATRLPVERGGSLKADFIDSKFNPGRPDCPNVIRVPTKEGGSGAGAEVGLRSLVCAHKVDLIGSSFDRGRATSGPTVIRVPVEGVLHLSVEQLNLLVGAHSAPSGIFLDGLPQIADGNCCYR
jgi:hypothetical protein